jgi:hypothetical protein
MDADEFVTKKFVLSRATKGAGVYSELLPDGEPCDGPGDPGVLIGTLYLRRDGVSLELGLGKLPDEVWVTVSTVRP